MRKTSLQLHAHPKHRTQASVRPGVCFGPPTLHEPIEFRRITPKSRLPRYATIQDMACVFPPKPTFFCALFTSPPPVALHVLIHLLLSSDLSGFAVTWSTSLVFPLPSAPGPWESQDLLKRAEPLKDEAYRFPAPRAFADPSFISEINHVVSCVVTSDLV